MRKRECKRESDSICQMSEPFGAPAIIPGRAHRSWSAKKIPFLHAYAWNGAFVCVTRLMHVPVWCIGKVRVCGSFVSVNVTHSNLGGEGKTPGS
mmetsp:Transcript_64569/g.94566  ORF Transcript_64569/g.94566 Transcript_64569/m.94566 type:complete len:94 (-) Transcript_64569:40-321(-)